MVQSGTISVTATNGSATRSASRAITVNSRTGWKLSAKSPTKVGNGTITTLPTPPSPGHTLGIGDYLYSWSLAGPPSISSGPNKGFAYYATNVNVSSELYRYQINPDLENSQSNFSLHQYGACGYISHQNLLNNVTKHESGSAPAKSHYSQYVSSLDTNNPGLYVEGRIALPGTNLTQFHNDTLNLVGNKYNTIVSDTLFASPPMIPTTIKQRGSFKGTSTTHRTVPANRIRRGKVEIMQRAILAVAVLASFAAGSGGAGEVVVLDLTKPPEKEARPRLGGGSGRGITGRPVPPPPKLPLKISLESIEPSSDGVYVKLITLLVTNAGDGPFLFPVSRDFDDVHGEGNQGRRSLLFRLRPAEQPGLVDGLGMAVTLSAAGRLDSTMRLEPGQAVRVRLKAHLGIPPAIWKIPEDRTIRVQAQIVQTLFDDRTDLYMIKEMRDAVSENSLPLVIP
jgi:hypothetical protein